MTVSVTDSTNNGANFKSGLNFWIFFQQNIIRSLQFPLIRAIFSRLINHLYVPYFIHLLWINMDENSLCTLLLKEKDFNWFQILPRVLYDFKAFLSCKRSSTLWSTSGQLYCPVLVANGLFEFTGADSDSDPTPIRFLNLVARMEIWNLPCSVKRSEY